MIWSRLIMAAPFFIFGTSTLTAGGHEDRWGMGVQPIIGYDDDASWTLGANSAFYFNPNPEDENQELDELGLVTTCSFNGGANIHADYTKNLRGNDRNINIVAGCEKYTDYYYGADGNADREAYTTIDVPLELTYSFKIADHLYLSTAYNYRYLNIDGLDGTDSLLSEGIMENDNLRASGVGVGISYQTTNPGVYKRRGYKLSTSSMYYSEALGSSSSFEIAGIGYRHYFPVFGSCVLGFQARGEVAMGDDIPSYYLPQLGGNKLLRGFSGSRYKGRKCLAGQVEFRFPIWWRCGATAFAGIGEAADEFSDFGTRVKAAGGIGFRFAVQKKQNINIRFDLAYNSDGELKKYIKLKEAF